MKILDIFNKQKTCDVSQSTCDVVQFTYDVARRSKKTKIHKSALRNVARHLNNYAASRKIEILSNTLNSGVIEDFIDYLKDQDLSKSTICHIVLQVKMIWNRMKEAGYAVDATIHDVSVKNEVPDKVALSSDEVVKIYNLNIKSKEVQEIRDVFIVGCLTGMRYSDYSQLTSKNIVNGCIVRKTAKTGITVVIPIHDTIKQILLKRNGEFPRCPSSQQNFNKVVKNICKRAGITDEVLVERTKGHKVIRKRYKKYELVSSHTARRSFATNAYLAGIPTARIMLITGHKTEEAFFRYIRINKTENAKILAEHAFFRK